MNSIWEKVMSSLRAQFFQRVLIQKVNARIRLAQVCRVILITPLTFTMYALRYSSVGDLSIFFFFVNAGLSLNYIGDSPGRLHRGLHKISSLCRRSSSKRISRAILKSLIHLRMHVSLRVVNAKDIRGKIIVDEIILPSSLATTPTEDGKENRAGNGKTPQRGE
ncbi:hypothetical protein MTR67_032989 [Solanum verrucosum]|uniref:Uncharacterized protein n=1 Tax=Solanum verrucosum TaxID=315347 RepID=A0AAF0ZJQ6_SOLVR|nr:hypothetical protein MTR67_032989 [Solanum verrucosum]